MNKKIIKFDGKKFTQPISCLTTYSPGVAKILDGNIDLILIGDSLGTTLYDMKNTQYVTMDMMMNHGRAVNQYIKKSISVIDMPFKTYQKKEQAYKNAKKLLDYTKAKFVKLEVDSTKIDIIEFLSRKKINIIAHIGVTPQSYKDFSKIRVLGKKLNERNKLVQLALSLEKAGAKSILLECIDQKTAKIITNNISIPTIGIGASKFCDGQILVFDDVINLNTKEKKPKFVKSYMNFKKLFSIAIKKYNKEVKLKRFPGKKNTYA